MLNLHLRHADLTPKCHTRSILQLCVQITGQCYYVTDGSFATIQQGLFEGMLKYTCNLKSFQGLPYHQILELSSCIAFFAHCSLSVQINIMQTSSGSRGCAQHGAWSLLLGSSVDVDDIQMSTPGTVQRLGEVVQFPGNPPRHSRTSRWHAQAFLQTALHSPIKDRTEKNAGWCDLQSSMGGGC